MFSNSEQRARTCGNQAVLLRRIVVFCECWQWSQMIRDSLAMTRKDTRMKWPCLLTQVENFYIHGCQPENNLHKFLGSLASRIKWFTCPLTLSNVPSSTPSSFCLNRTRTRSAILLTELSSKLSRVSKTLELVTSDEASISGFLCKDIAFKGLSVHTYSGSNSRTLQ